MSRTTTPHPVMERSSPITGPGAHGFRDRLSDSAGTQDEFARITWVGTTVTSTSEVGALDVDLMDAGTLQAFFRLQRGNIRFDRGAAITAGEYAVGRDADATNQWHANVPTGAGFEFSINDVARLTLNTDGVLNVLATTGNSFVVDTNVLVVDATNNRVGINQATPLDELHVLTNVDGGGIRLERTSATAGTFTLALNSAGNFDIRETGVAQRFHVMLTTGNIKIAGIATRSATEGTNHLDIFNGTAPVGTLANGVSLYAVAGEFRVMSAGGIAINLTQGALVADAAGGATVDAEARTAINTLLARLRVHALIAT